MRTKTAALTAAMAAAAVTTAVAVWPTGRAGAGALAPASLASAATGRSPCATALTAPRYQHVIWVWMENHSYSTIVGSTQAPYANLLATQCGLATNYHNVSHPSLPNYIAATSGLSLLALGPFESDCTPSASCSTAAPGIFGQGETAKAYEDSMPSACDRHNSGEYAARHNPPLYYRTLAGCTVNDVPYSRFRTDLDDGGLPAFSFITPNLIHDMHSGTVAQGDSWLAANLPTIFASSEYRSGATAVFITWDEGEGGSSDDCANNTADIGCHVATIVVSPSTAAGTTSGRLFNHYGLLATAEQLLGLPMLGQAVDASTLTSAFNL